MEWREDDLEGLAKETGASPVDVSHALDVLRANGLTNFANADKLLRGTIRAMLDFAGAPQSASSPTPPTSHGRRWMVSDEGPADWKMHCLSVLNDYRPAQRRIIGLFGLPDPLGDVFKIAPLIRSMEAIQNRTGAYTTLYFPTDECPGFGVHWETCHVWEGFDRRTISEDAPAPPSAPLFQLATEANMMSDETGLEPHRAVEFLLSDTVTSLPWIRAWVEPHDALGVEAVTIKVGTTAARPNEIAAVYAALVAPRPNLLDDDRVWGDIYIRARTSERVASMVAFVDAWKRQQKTDRVPWKTLMALFNEAHPEHAPFTNPNSMKTQYHSSSHKEARHG